MSGILTHEFAPGDTIVVFCDLTVVIGPVYQAPLVKKVEVETVAIRIVRFVYVAFAALFAQNQRVVILFPAGAGDGRLNPPVDPAGVITHCTFLPVEGFVLKGKTLEDPPEVAA